MKRNHLGIIALAFLLSFVAGCESKEPAQTADLSEPVTKSTTDKPSTNACDSTNKNASYVTAKVKKVALEGGFYGLLGDNNQKFLPVNLDSEHQVEGASISFTYEPVTDMQSIAQWGEMIRITDICSVQKPQGMTSGDDSNL